MVALSLEELLNQFRGIWNERFGVRVDGGYCKDGVFADVSMAMLQTGSGGS